MLEKQPSRTPATQPVSDADSGSETDMPPSAAVEKVKTNTGSDWQPSRDFYLAMLALMVLSLAVSFDATILSTALPIISLDLGASATEAFWAGTSFVLASTVLQPTVAAFSVIWGRRNMVYVSSVLFFAGALLAGLARNPTVLLAGRTLQGVGGGGLFALTEVIVTDLVPLQFRATWFSLVAAIWALGTVAGPLIGAGFAQNASWRWVFYINLPVIGLAIIATFFFLNQVPVGQGQGVRKRLARFDWVGSFLFVASATGLLFGITTGGTVFPWGSWRVILPIVVGPIGFVAFAIWEWKWAAEPIVEAGVFSNWDMINAYIQTLFHGAITWSLIYIVSLYYLGVKGYSPIISSVALLPETLGVAPAAAIVGIIISAKGHYRWAVFSGWVIATLGAGLLIYLEPGTSIPAWIFLNVPISLGLGILFPAQQMIVQAAAPPHLMGQTAAFFSFMRTFGQSVGIAVSSAIFQNAFKRKLLEAAAEITTPSPAAVAAVRSVTQQVPSVDYLVEHAEEFARDATAVVSVLQGMPGEDPARQVLVRAYSLSLREVFIALTAFAGAMMFLGFTVKGYTLKQEHVTNQGLVRSDKEEKEREEKQQGNTV